MPFSIQRRRLTLALGAAPALFAHSLRAQNAWPDRVVKIILPSGPGSSLDIAARLVGEPLSQALHQPVLVEGRPGASGMIATTAVTKAAADGYTLLLMNTSVLQNVLLQPKPPYSLAELTPIAMISKNPICFAVSSSVKANTLAEFARLVKADPTGYTYGSAGRGSATNIIPEMFKRAAKIEMTHVPYNGEGPLVNALAGGQVSAAMGSPGVYARQAPRVKLLAITGTARDPSLPDVPTFAEAGFPQITIEGGFFGFFAPAGTPKPVCDRLSREIVAAMKLPQVQQGLVTAGLQPLGYDAAQFADYIRVDLARWQAAIRENNISLD